MNCTFLSISYYAWRVWYDLTAPCAVLSGHHLWHCEHHRARHISRLLYLQWACECKRLRDVSQCTYHSGAQKSNLWHYGHTLDDCDIMWSLDHVIAFCKHVARGTQAVRSRSLAISSSCRFECHPQWVNPFIKSKSCEHLEQCENSTLPFFKTWDRRRNVLQAVWDPHPLNVECTRSNGPSLRELWTPSWCHPLGGNWKQGDGAGGCERQPIFVRRHVGVTTFPFSTTGMW